MEIVETVALILGYAVMAVAGFTVLGIAIMWVVEQTFRTLKLNKAIIDYFFYRKEFHAWREQRKLMARAKKATEPEEDL